ncbi:hypothetical protein FGRMN_2913 [Fusarium graminum]|nr:hypothetical protein FGRMN_2913 [Fusarium graminum]
MAWWWVAGARPKKAKKSKKTTTSKAGAKVNTKANIKVPKPSITDPPNVYLQVEPQTHQAYYAIDSSYPSALPANILRPKQSLQSTMPHNSPYDHHYHTQSQPQLYPPPHLIEPPAYGNVFPPPVVVNNHYHLNSPASHQNLVSLNQPNLNTSQLQPYDDGLSAWHGGAQLQWGTQVTRPTNPMYERFDDVMTRIDCEKLDGTEYSLFRCGPNEGDRHVTFKGVGKDKKKDKAKCNIAASVVSGNYFSKVELYANSKLSLRLPALSLHVPTWPLLCLAAQYSQRVYEKPQGSERDAYIPSDWLVGPRQTCIKSVSKDDSNTIVFAIRGTASFMDWAVNLKSVPVSPVHFLDDPGNMCHAGFLSVAKKMVRPVAARLRQLLRENPARSRYSLLITGHSAGGAIAALLYSHMVAQTVGSELNVLANNFKRIHCITFGAPPVSLLPLAKPESPYTRKSVFLSIVNEGDPVVRADKAYVKSLLDLLSSPPPPHRKESKSRSRSRSRDEKPTWKVPVSTLSNAGRIVVLRSGDPHAEPKDRKTVQERRKEGVLAVTCVDQDLRGVIWGDPVCHLMELYLQRVEALAFQAVTARS